MGMFRYLKAAFAARPWGMWVPPSWVGLAAFGLLGIENPGFWLVGAGLELGYLIYLSSNARFQRLVDGQQLADQKQSSQLQVGQMVARLESADQKRYHILEQRCQQVLAQQRGHDGAQAAGLDIQAQADGLGKLVFVYLKLLLTRQTILRVLDGGNTDSIDKKLADATRQLQAAKAPELQKSLTDQIEILQERKKRHAEAHDKLAFIEAELTRIQEQVELIREGLVMTSDPESLSKRIDQIGDTLGTTSQWIRQQQELYGQTEDLLGDPPSVVLEGQTVAEK